MLTSNSTFIKIFAAIFEMTSKLLLKSLPLITLLAFMCSYSFRQLNLLLCSVGLQDRLEWLRQDLVADLGVGNSPVLLAQVKAQLALVAEVKVALFTLVRHEVNRSNQG